MSACPGRGVRARGPQQTRHTFITRALEARAQIGAVAKAAGNSSTCIAEIGDQISDRAARPAAELASNEMHLLDWEWLERVACRGAESEGADPDADNPRPSVSWRHGTPLALVQSSCCRSFWKWDSMVLH